MLQVAEQSTGHPQQHSKIVCRPKILYHTWIDDGKWFLQYIFDMWMRIEGERLGFDQRQQSKLSAELYMNLNDAIWVWIGNEDTSIGCHLLIGCHFY